MKKIIAIGASLLLVITHSVFATGETTTPSSGSQTQSAGTTKRVQKNNKKDTIAQKKAEREKLGEAKKAEKAEQRAKKNAMNAEQEKALISCMKTATMSRETTILSITSTFTSTTSAAYNKRSTDIASAYDSGKTMKEIREIIKGVWQTWESSMKTARETNQNERKQAWDTYNTAVKACKPDNATNKDLQDTTNSEQKAEGNVL